ncbi:MAG TPA: nucleotide disphospho-sugar-binding domain-containing protein [Actinomycetota bacterium]|nr:nucleotide disphospho-sugar-binding domain-containing protein [Actinomycetota bacterium]
MTDALTFLFMPESAYGPTNNCIGIGAQLQRRGHRVVFAAEASWRGRLEPLGFEEDVVDLAPAVEGEQDAGQFWTDFVAGTAPEFRTPTIEQLDTFIRPVWVSLIEGARYCESRLREILDRTRPDVIVEDNVSAFPALLTHGAPWVRIMSCNPLEMKDPDLPPTFSGYPTDDRTGWEAFRAEYDRTHRELWSDFDGWIRDQGAPPLPDLEFIHESPYLNLSIYPGAADYLRSVPLASTWRSLESSVRDTEEPWRVPDQLLDRDGALVYLSLGSLGSADVELMRRLIDVLSRSRHRFVVSKGPRADELELADNMWGEARVPQTSIIPEVDLVITHGGNNTVTEALHFGKPMVVLPLFWDQYDNAQRIDELGFGVRLATYGFVDDELTTAVDGLLEDEVLRASLDALGARIRGFRGTERAADLIEDLGHRSRDGRGR